MNTYTIEANGSGPLVLNGNINGLASDTMLVLSGNSTSNNSVNGVISGASTSVAKTGSGTWRLSGQSTYGGRLTVCEGTLVVGSNVNSTGSSPFGTQTVTLPQIGDTSAMSGTAALLLGNNVTVDRGFSVATAAVGSAQVVELGGASSGTSAVSSLAAIALNRSVTLRAAASGTVTFRNFWSGGGSAVGVTVGSDSNNGTVGIEQALPAVLSGFTVANGRADLFESNLVDPNTSVTVGSSLGSATLNLNEEYFSVSQTLSSTLSFAGNLCSITGGTLRLNTSIPVSVSGTGHVISSLVALDAAATFNTGSSTATLALTNVVSNGINGAQGLTKTGLGTLTLSAANTYTGTTTINDGTLKANNVSAFGSGDIVVNSGGTLDRNGYAISNNIVNNGGVVL